MLNSKKFKLKKLICCATLCLGILLSFCVGFIPNHLINVSAKSISNYITNDVSKDLLGETGHNFNTSSSVKPATPSSWSEASGSKNKDNIQRGIVNIENDTTFDTKVYKKTSRPTILPQASSDNNSHYKVLMINAHNGSGRFGYKNSFTLQADSFYSISVNLYTHRTTKNETAGTEDTDPTASIYLTGLTDDESYKTSFENINTNKAWVTYTFYVDTNESKSVDLELWLGSKSTDTLGAVFFNKVTINRYSEDYYYENIIETKQMTAKDSVISLSEKFSTPFDNSSFEYNLLGWTSITSSPNDNVITMGVKDVNNDIKVSDTKTISAPGGNNSINNNKALYLNNISNGYQGIQSSDITFKQHAFYSLSFYAKSDCNTGNGATVKLVDQEEDSTNSASITLATKVSSSNDSIYRNDWTKYTFYIAGPADKDNVSKVQIWLGTEESSTTGYVFVDDFKILPINYATYSSNSSASNSTQYNLNNETDNYVITNSFFNRTKNAEETVKYPLSPLGWEYSTTSEINSYSGIISTEVTHFNNNVDNYYNSQISTTKPINPAKLPYMVNNSNNNNVLMMGNTSATNTQSYKSSDITLNAESYYKISFYALSNYVNYNSNNNLGARIKLSTSQNTLFDLYNLCELYNDKNWHLFEIYIKTGFNSETANLQFIFDKLTGYVFFDEVLVEDSSEAVFNSVTESKSTYIVDLSRDNFDNRTFNKKEDLQTPNNWTFSDETDYNLNINDRGIKPVNTFNLENLINTPSGNKNVLFLSSLHDVNINYKSINPIMYNSDTYYKITVNVFTSLISTDNDNEESDILAGATIKMANIDGVEINGINTNNTWKTYTIYMFLEESITSDIELGLGTKDQSSKGTVLFDNLQITTIDADTYNNEFASANDELIKVYIQSHDHSSEETTTEEESTWENNFNWLILPSLFTALAIVIALVGFYARKLKFTRKPKIKTKYDRRKTLDREISKREKIALRKQIIDELNTELTNIDKEIEEFNQLAEEQLQKIKDQIIEEQEEIKRKKLELEIEKKEYTAKREKQLKENPELVSNTKAEKEFSAYITKLDKQQLSLQKQLTNKEDKLSKSNGVDKSKLEKLLARKEFIYNEISKIELEIENIAREEEDMWEEYKIAREDAKKQKAEFKKNSKEKSKKSQSTKTVKVADNVETKKDEKQTKKTSSKKEIEKSEEKKKEKVKKETKKD